MVSSAATVAADHVGFRQIYGMRRDGWVPGCVSRVGYYLLQPDRPMQTPKLAHELATMPLASGMRPTVLRRPAAVTRVIGETPVHKFVGRASQKILRHQRGLRRYAVGAPALAELVAEHWRNDPSLLEPVAKTDLVNQTWLSRLQDGVVAAEAATVDFILNLSVLI